MAKKIQSIYQQEFKAPKTSENFTKLAYNDYVITFNKETNRYVLKKSDAFIISDGGVDNIKNFCQQCWSIPVTVWS